MSKPKAPMVMIDADELERLRLYAARYTWIRERAARGLPDRMELEDWPDGPVPGVTY